MLKHRELRECLLYISALCDYQHQTGIVRHFKLEIDENAIELTTADDDRNAISSCIKWVIVNRIWMSGVVRL